MRKTHRLNILTVQVVARDKASTRQLAATILHDTSLQGEQSSATAVAEVQMKRNRRRSIEIGPEALQQEGLIRPLHKDREI